MKYWYPWYSGQWHGQDIPGGGIRLWSVPRNFSWDGYATACIESLAKIATATKQLPEGVMLHMPGGWERGQSMRYDSVQKCPGSDAGACLVAMRRIRKCVPWMGIYVGGIPTTAALFADEVEESLAWATGCNPDLIAVDNSSACGSSDIAYAVMKALDTLGFRIGWESWPQQRQVWILRPQERGWRQPPMPAFIIDSDIAIKRAVLADPKRNALMAESDLPEITNLIGNDGNMTPDAARTRIKETLAWGPQWRVMCATWLGEKGVC